MKPLAGTMTLAIQNGIDQRLRVALQNPQVNAALLKAIGFTHERLVRVLRGESDALVVVDGYVMLNVFPVVGAALDGAAGERDHPGRHRAAGPELAGRARRPRPAPRRGARHHAAADVRDDPADARRQAAGGAVGRADFDLLVVVLIVLTLVLVALTLWLAARRRRMVVFLAIGTIIAFLIARSVIGSIENTIVSGIADGDVRAAVRALVDATLEDLRSLTDHHPDRDRDHRRRRLPVGSPEVGDGPDRAGIPAATRPRPADRASVRSASTAGRLTVCARRL